MTTLEDVLQEHFGLLGYAFRESGEFTNNGFEAYCNLIDTLNVLGDLTGMDMTQLIDRLDAIEHDNV